MATSNSEENSGKLSDFLDEALKLYYKIKDSAEATSSENVQADIRRAIELCEEATRMVSYAGIFSRNEVLSDIATADIQFLILPFLLGNFTSQLVSKDRTNLIKNSQIYYKDFLQRTNDYGLSNFNEKPENENNSSKKNNKSVQDACKFREMKIKQFEEKQKLQTLVTDLKQVLDRAEDATRREYYINLIKYFVFIAIDELNFLKTEIEMLEHMKKLGPKSKQPEKSIPSKPFQVVLITKDMVQKAVFGSGYPSLPIMTVQEFYDKRVEDGIFPDPTKPKTGPMSLQEASLAGISLNDEAEKENEEKETKIEKDDEEYLERMREKDNYKDDHRRGWGNRANRS